MKSMNKRVVKIEAGWKGWRELNLDPRKGQGYEWKSFEWRSERGKGWLGCGRWLMKGRERKRMYLERERELQH